jgi:hypothetical protein
VTILRAKMSVKRDGERAFITRVIHCQRVIIKRIRGTKKRSNRLARHPSQHDRLHGCKFGTNFIRGML